MGTIRDVVSAPGNAIGAALGYEWLSTRQQTIDTRVGRNLVAAGKKAGMDPEALYPGLGEGKQSATLDEILATVGPKLEAAGVGYSGSVPAQRQAPAPAPAPAGAPAGAGGAPAGAAPGLPVTDAGGGSPLGELKTALGRLLDATHEQTGEIRNLAHAGGLPVFPGYGPGRS